MQHNHILGTISPQWMSKLVYNRWSSDGMVTNHRYGLSQIEPERRYGILWPFLALSGSLSGSLWFSLALCDSLSGSLLLPLSESLWLPSDWVKHWLFIWENVKVTILLSIFFIPHFIFNSRCFLWWILLPRVLKLTLSPFKLSTLYPLINPALLLNEIWANVSNPLNLLFAAGVVSTQYICLCKKTRLKHQAKFGNAKNLKEPVPEKSAKQKSIESIRSVTENLFEFFAFVHCLAVGDNL